MTAVTIENQKADERGPSAAVPEVADEVDAIPTEVEHGLTRSGRGGSGQDHAERVVVVANRLPVKAERIGQRQWRFEERGGGGLVSALQGFCSFTFSAVTLFLSDWA